MENNEQRETSLDWWRKLSQATQQNLQARYFPDDDFMVTDKSSLRIETIYVYERLKNKLE